MLLRGFRAVATVARVVGTRRLSLSPNTVERRERPPLEPARCSEQNRRKAVTQSHGTTATSVATSAGPPAHRPFGSKLAALRFFWVSNKRSSAGRSPLPRGSAKKANPAKAGDAKPRGYRTLRRAKPVELPNLLGGDMYFYNKGYRLVTALVLLAACDLRPRGGGTGVDTPVTQVVVYPDALTLDPFQSFQFRVFGRTEAGDSVPVSVSWAASAGTISQSGMYSADASAADAVVTATLTSSAVRGSSRVKKRLVIQLLINPKNTALRVGGSQQFFVYGRNNTGDSVSVPVTYSATGGTVSGGGWYAAGQTAGTYRVIANQNAGSLADTSSITLSVVPVASIVVSPATGALAPGGTLQLSASTFDSASNLLTGRAVSWSSSAAGVATVSASGLVTGVAAGNATITATSEGRGGTAAIAVAAVPVPVASVTVSPATASITVGQTTQLTATPKDAGGNPLSGRVVTWASSATA